ncbi:MAG: hypothetical protein COA96_09915 [SAR86 cluster bacterium]|uniref:SCO family protein n=1 Tax=SAR86 cluster bacterium TaxID=2030880 RepID=A0A2A5AYH6_9GAMM|nr:MAG: hypothetical protein COA96_09915 [SAR86 cluster bacterium]
MKLTRRAKGALIAFVLFDLALLVFMLDLFQLRAAHESELALRELGVTIFPEPRSLTDFKLQDHHGNAFTREDFIGSWNLVFFGFTSCPDICPLTMAELKQFYEALDVAEEDIPQIILVTVDPARDTAEMMTSYLSKYNEDFIGLNGDAESISILAKQLYVVHSVDLGGETVESHNHTEDSSTSDTSSPANDYLINHSAHISIISPAGDYFAVMRAPHRNQDIDEAFQQIISF